MSILRCLQSRYATPLVVTILLGVHVCLEAWLGYVHSPNLDEVAHLPCGMAIWRAQRNDLYCVNPPLTRLIAALPVCLLTDAKLPELPPVFPFRQEFPFGDAFLQLNGPDAIWYFRLARWCCIPFSILGALICYFWAKELFGNQAGVASLTLWCFSPNILCWASTICPDLSATSLGLLTCYCFWHWLKRPGLMRATGVGIVLGLCELSKMTWLPLLGILPFLWGAWLWLNRTQYRPSICVVQAAQLTWSIVVALYVLNLAYLFVGTFRPLSDYEFRSKTLASFTESQTLKKAGVLGIPLPFPSQYIHGLDFQKHDFERGLDSYLMGKWEHHGWWYYYLVGLALKVPLGTLLLVGIASVVWGYNTCWHKGQSLMACAPCDCLILLLPGVFVIAFVSTQAGFSRHFRYVLAALPFLFIWAGSVFAPTFRRTSGKWKIVPHCLIAWSVASSLLVFPHTFSYFNELAGGPQNGHYFLLDSNIDWQQDVLKLKAWLDKHKEASPISVDYYGGTSPERFGVVSSGQPPLGKDAKSRGTCVSGTPSEYGPLPGWYAISVHCLHHPEKDYSYFFHFQPVAMAGYSIYIYHITIDEANQVRRELRLPELSKDWQVASSVSRAPYNSRAQTLRTRTP